MKDLRIIKIQLNGNYTLCVYPSTDENLQQSSEYIYRSAMGVYWNKDELYFYNKPATDTKSLFEWYKRILSAVESELGFRLTTDTLTEFENIDEKLKEEIINI